MKEKLFTVFILILSFNCYAQTSFENGYFIDNEGQKTSILIKNLDWKNNPTEFQYKLSENGDPKIATIESVKEWGVSDKLKYRRFTVNIDRSSENIERLSSVRNAEFNEEQLFLKVLVEGKANLYLFEDGSLRRYFFKTDNSGIEQLVYKIYLTPDNTIGKNKEYKHQLWNTLKCKDFPITVIDDVDYKKNDLVKYFIKYNECHNSEFTNYEKKQKNDFFNLTIRPSLNSSAITLHNNKKDIYGMYLGRELGFRFGIEAEFILPFNNNKWAFIFEPTYQYFKSEEEFENKDLPFYKRDVKVDYKSIEFPIGLRHYFFINKSSKIFVNGSLISEFSHNSMISFERIKDSERVTEMNLKLRTRNKVTVGFGMGYKYNEKLSLELRHSLNRDIIGNVSSMWHSDYNTFSIIFGYTIF